MSTCNWLDLQTLGSQPVMPKNLPITALSRGCWHYLKQPMSPKLGLRQSRQFCMKENVLYIILALQMETQSILGCSFLHTTFDFFATGKG